MNEELMKKMVELKGKETGERLDLKQTYKWILNEMSYYDFCKLFVLRFENKRYDKVEYCFEYSYRPEKDSSEARENFLKYLAYKLIQNLATNGVELK